MLIVGIVGWVLFNQTRLRPARAGDRQQPPGRALLRHPDRPHRILVMTLMGFIVGIAAVVVLAFNRNGSPTVGVGTELSRDRRHDHRRHRAHRRLRLGAGRHPRRADHRADPERSGPAARSPPAWSTAVTGIVIIVAVTLDYLIKRRSLAVRRPIACERRDGNGKGVMAWRCETTTQDASAASTTAGRCRDRQQRGSIDVSTTTNDSWC